MRKKRDDTESRRNLEKWFKAWTVTFEQEARIKRLRKAAFDFGLCVIECVDHGPDRDAALRHIREAMMTANNSVASELSHGPA